MNPTIYVHSRRKINLDNLQEGDIFINDIAHSLAYQCRFNGHTKAFYSVAEHSVRIAQYFAHSGFKRKLILAALLHDAAETYIGDIVRPVKYNYLQIEEKEKEILDLIYKRFDCEVVQFDWQMIMIVDNLILNQELNALVLQEILMPAAPLTFRFECWPPEVAEIQFKKMFKKYAKGDGE